MLKRMLVPAFVAALGSAVTIVAVGLANEVLLKGLDANRSVSLVVNGVEKPLGAAGSNGELRIPLDAGLDAALDPNKNYVVFKRDCNRYEIVVQGSEDERRCRGEQSRNPEPGEPCGRCVPAGLITKGVFTAPPPAAGSHSARNLGIGAAAVAAAGLATWAVRRGDDPAPRSLTELAGLSVQGSLSITSNPCNAAFGNPATIQLRILAVNADGSASFQIIHVSANNTTFSGTGRLTAQADGTIAIAVDPVTISTLQSRGEGSINKQWTQVTLLNSIVRLPDNCIIVYGPGTLN